MQSKGHLCTYPHSCDAAISCHAAFMHENSLYVHKQMLGRPSNDAGSNVILQSRNPAPGHGWYGLERLTLNLYKLW